MNKKVRQEVRAILMELEEHSNREELFKLRTFLFNVNHIIYNPEYDDSPQNMIEMIQKELDKAGW